MLIDNTILSLLLLKNISLPKCPACNEINKEGIEYKYSYIS